MNFVRLSAETARLAPFSLSPRQRAACTCLYTSVTAQSAAMLGATGAKRSYPQFNPAAEPTGATSEINAAVTRSAHANRARGAVGLSSSNRSRVSNCAVAAANPSALKVHQVQVAAAQSDKASMLCQLEAASSWPCAVAEPFAAAAAGKWGKILTPDAPQVQVAAAEHRDFCCSELSVILTFASLTVHVPHACLQLLSKGSRPPS